MNTLQPLLTIAALACVMPLSHAAAGSRPETLFSFNGPLPAGLTFAGGVLYGVASGPPNNICGSAFVLNPPSSAGGAWTETILYTFVNYTQACLPYNGPLVGPGGTLSGLTSHGGITGLGAFYQLTPPAAPGGGWTESGYNSSNPLGGLVAGPGGSFYNLAAGGNGYGELAQLQPPAAPGGSWTLADLFNLLGQGPYSVPSLLVAGPGGVLYGGGDANNGTFAPAIIQLTPPPAPGAAWTETIIRVFPDLAHLVVAPNSLTVAGDGVVYGTTYGYQPGGPYSHGLVFALAPPASPGGTWRYTVLKDFGGNFTGGHPNGPLLLHNGNLYGVVDTSDSQGSNVGGAVFELQPPAMPGGAWTTTYLHRFTNGQVPAGNLVIGYGGALYGMTIDYTLGASVTGTIFRIFLE